MDDEYMDVSDSLSFAIISRDRSLSFEEPIWRGEYYSFIKFLTKDQLPILWYTPSMDGYCLYNDNEEPVWTEEGGYGDWGR